MGSSCGKRDEQMEQALMSEEKKFDKLKVEEERDKKKELT